MFDNAQSIIDVLMETFPKNRFSIDIAYGGMSLRVVDNKETNVYLRIAYRDAGTRVEVSSIELDKEIRRKGYFTHMIRNLYAVPHVKTIIVPNVLTEEMKLACTKIGMEFDDSMYGYVMHREE